MIIDKNKIILDPTRNKNNLYSEYMLISRKLKYVYDVCVHYTAEEY